MEPMAQMLKNRQIKDSYKSAYQEHKEMETHTAARKTTFKKSVHEQWSKDLPDHTKKQRKYTWTEADQALEDILWAS